jgi:phosphatidylserine/phosphatidylglycerophosphate/cardiolipin synthase-like enzyme
MLMLDLRRWMVVLGLVFVAVSVPACVGDETGGDAVDDGKADAWADSTEPREFVGVAQEHIQGWGGDGESLDVYFIPFNAVEDRIAREIQLAQSSIRVAMYNLRSERLGFLLLERQRAGIRVEVYLDARQMEQPYNDLDDRLRAEGLNIIAVRNTNSSTATLHDKLAVIDDRVVFMGSANWGDSALHQNNEVTMAFTSTELARAVNQELDELASGRHDRRAGDVNSHVQLHSSPEDRVDTVVEHAIDNAQERIYAAVFSFRLSWLTDAMIEAHRRGVEVVLITDRKQSETTQEDDRLRQAGIPVIEALNDVTPYTAMHHKFVVIDGATTLVGSYNWTYSATFHNYEDLAVIADDPEVAAAFEGEFGRVWQRYAPDQPNPITRTVPLDVMVQCDATQWGDTVVLVGNTPELGAWDPSRGVRLSGDQWPSWNGLIDLRIGAALEYKFVVLSSDGAVRWETGDDHLALLTTDPDELAIRLRHEFRE